MGMHDRCDVGPRLHDLKVQEALIHRLDAPFEPVSFDVDGDDVVDIGVDKRAALGMDMPEDEHFVSARNARADMTFGQRPDTACGEDAVRLGESLAQVQYFGFQGGFCISMNGSMQGHEWMLRRSLITTTVATLAAAIDSMLRNSSNSPFGSYFR
jgi:hypothetical protein